MFKNMPWAAHEHDQHEGDTTSHEESLTSILTSVNDRSELTLLVANCIETMRICIVGTFDARQLGDRAPTKVDRLPPGGDKAWIDHVKADIAAQEKAQKDLTARERDLDGKQMQDLKADTLKHFDDWREAVILRVGEVVNNKETAESQKSQPTSTSSPRLPSRIIDSGEVGDHRQAVAEILNQIFPPVETPLADLGEAQRALILHSLLLLFLSLEHYSAHSRTLLVYLANSLHLSPSLLTDDENKVARGLLAAADMKAEDETKKKAEENAGSRKWKVGLATVAGAAVIGITGGLAAPLLAAGVGSVMGGLGLGATATAGYLGSLASSGLLVGGLFGAYGGRMTGQMMDQYAREVEDFAFVPITTYHKPRKIEKEYRRLRVIIGVSGWLTDKDEVVAPWRVLGTDLEGFALRYELEALLSLGNALTTMIASAAWGFAKSEILRRTIFASLAAALWPLGLLKISRIIDNPFSVAKARADKAGEVLADAIINKAQGERPVTLIGYSLGARLIYTCLKRLAERRAFGLVESVILMGAPTPSTAADWRMIRSVATGRVVNVYSTQDSILAFLYRSSSIQYGIAGLQPIEDVKGVQSIDVTNLVPGHTAYRFMAGSILSKIGFEDVDMEAVRKQEEEQAQVAQKEERERQDDDKTGQLDGNVSDDQVKELEKTVEDKNQKSMIAWTTEKLQQSGATAATAAARAKAWYIARGSAEEPPAPRYSALGDVDEDKELTPTVKDIS